MAGALLCAGIQSLPALAATPPAVTTHSLAIQPSVTKPPAVPATLARIAEVSALTPSQAAQAIPVRLEAVVTFYEPAEGLLFVQDPTGAIFVRAPAVAAIHQGSRVIVSGVSGASYRNMVVSRDIQSIGEAPLPIPRPAGFSDLINGVVDTQYVLVKGTVLSSTIESGEGTPFLLLNLLVDGGPVTVNVLDFAGTDPSSLLDAEISFAGTSGKLFDGKYQAIGAKVYVSKISAIHVLFRSPVRIADLPLSPLDWVQHAYSVNNRGPRIRVRGSVILYIPREILVLDHQGKTLLVHIQQNDPLTIGQVVDATGFADYQDYGPSLSYGQFTPTSENAPVTAQPLSYDQLMTGEHSYNLVSLTGVLMAEVSEDLQDTLVIRSGEHLFSAVFRSHADLPPLQIGSILRVTGVCMNEAYGPYNTPLAFSLRLRSPADVAVLGLPSWMTVTRLSLIAGLLLMVVVTTLLWGTMLRRRVTAQTELIRRAADEDAAWERRSVYLERERSKVLEAINSSQPLDSVLTLIAAFVSKQIWGVTCSFRLASPETWDPDRRNSALTGDPAPLSIVASGPSTEAPVNGAAPDIVNIRTIKSGDGIEVAEMLLSTDGKWRSTAHIEEVLDIGGRLAALAIENRMLHAKLVHRSEYDQLTDVPNRFLIEGRLEGALAEARKSGGQLAVIYIDLDEFKQVNDVYGHRIGDLYLQQAAQRLSAQLRDRDLIARVGGDEFLAIIHDISGRGEAEGVARRLDACFSHPFSIEESKIRGSASIGIAIFPEDGHDGEELKRSADHAMYTFKRQAKLASSETAASGRAAS